MNTTSLPQNLVSVKYLARTFHQLPDQLVGKLRALGIEAVTHLDGVPYYSSDVVEQLTSKPERLVQANKFETT